MPSFGSGLDLGLTPAGPKPASLLFTEAQRRPVHVDVTSGVELNPAAPVCKNR
jgi:hypothetical protein